MSRTISTSELENIVVAGINPRDYPDFCDAYIEEACWKATGEPLTDDELDLIDPDDAYEEIFDQALGM
jgi:hypothetical protein